MSDMREHNALRDLLAAAALDALSPEERAALDAHLATCADCTRDLASLRDGAAAFGASLPARPMPPDAEARVRARLLARAAADRRDPAVFPADAPAMRPTVSVRTPAQAPVLMLPTAARRAPVRWLAAAAAVIAVGALAYSFSLRSTIARLSIARSKLADSTSVLQRRLADQQAVIDGLTGPGVRVIDASAANARQPYARMFWDQPTNRWTFVAYNLPEVAAGHTYQLWLVTRDKRKVSAGTFTPTPNGSALVRATYALPSDSLAAIAVTNEPAGGSPQPTTIPFLVGAAGKTD